MQEETGSEAPRAALSVRFQGMVVGAVALVVAGALLFLLGPGRGGAQEPSVHLARFVPSAEQIRSMQYETVGVRQFQTEIPAEGYVAANGGWASPGASGVVGRGMPVLPGQSADLIQAEADLATAHAQFVAATANEKRQHALYQAEGAALKDWQQAQVDATTAASALAAARNKLRALGKDDPSIQALERSGAAKAGRIFTIGNSSLVWLVANVREADAPHIHIGDRAEVTIPGLGGRTVSASISYIGSAIDPVTHRLPVAALYPNAERALRPNMLATFDIVDRDGAMAPAVPQNAVVYEGELAHLWVVQPNGNFVSRGVTVGRSQHGYSEIVKGLAAGERIVTGGALFIDQAPTGG